MHIHINCNYKKTFFPSKDFNSQPSKDCFQEIYHTLQQPQKRFIRAWNSKIIKTILGVQTMLLHYTLSSQVKCIYAHFLSLAYILGQQWLAAFLCTLGKAFLFLNLQEVLRSPLLLQVQVHSLVILALRVYVNSTLNFVAWEAYHNSLKTRFLCYYSEARDDKKQKGLYYN